MPRRPPHFKAFTSIKNHEKMRYVYGNNDLLALWTRLGIEAIERFADRTGDTFLVHDRELPALTGKGRADVARTWLRHLADISPISAERDADIWRITFPNFAEKQFDRETNGSLTVPSSSALRSPLSANKKQTPSESDAPSVASVDRALRLLAREPGSESSKRAWMERELPLLLAEAERMEPKDKTARSAAFRGIAIRYWRQHNGRSPPQRSLTDVVDQAVREVSRKRGEVLQ